MSALMARVARLDHDQVYWGLGAPISVDQVKSGDHVFCARELRSALPLGAEWVDVDCDLPGGKYRLAAPDAEHPAWRFEPLPPAQQKVEEGAPTLEQAFYDLLTIGAAAPRVKAWIAWMQSSMDETIREKK